MSQKTKNDEEKPLCDWSKKEYRERFTELCDAVRAPRYACVKCGRAAAQKGLLCKAKPLKSP